MRYVTVSNAQKMEAGLRILNAVTPTPEQIRSQLERILASPGFAGAERASRFLRYVVERTLAGEGEQLKEYVIGLEVFDRGQTYDPRVDSIVRVEAGRLRSKVDEYYAGPGRTDDVIIQLRRGGYAPTFEPRVPDEADEPDEDEEAEWPFWVSKRQLGFALFCAGMVFVVFGAWKIGVRGTIERPPQGPSIAVLPLASYSTDVEAQMLAARVTDGVTSELARLGTLSVVSHTSAQQYAEVRQPLRDIARALNAQLILEGNIREDGARLVIQVRLVDASIDRKFWVQDFAGAFADIPEMQRQIATGAANAAMQRR
jgi:TolB-like protein